MITSPTPRLSNGYQDVDHLEFSSSQRTGLYESSIPLLTSRLGVIKLRSGAGGFHIGDNLKEIPNVSDTPR